MKKGFTLIEMLIAIVVIGMIVGILVGLMGNPLKEATLGRTVAKLTDDLRSLGDAADYKYAYEVVAIDSNSQDDAEADLAGAGAALKVMPVPPSMEVADMDGNTDGNQQVYAITTDPEILSAWGDSGTPDTAIYTYVTEDVCTRINENMGKSSTTVVDGTVADVNAAIDTDFDIQCLRDAADGNFRVYKVLNIDATYDSAP